MVVVVVVKRHAVVFALDQASTWCVVLCGCQCQSSVLSQGIDSLNEPFPKCAFAHDQPAIMVLDGSADDLCCRGGPAIHQYNQRIILAAVAVCGTIDLLGRISSVVRDDYLPFVQEFVGYANSFAEQAARVLPQVED